MLSLHIRVWLEELAEEGMRLTSKSKRLSARKDVCTQAAGFLP
jgi:hypothetical protein